MPSARAHTLVRLELHRWQKGETPTNIGYSLIEPWSLWTSEYLKTRYAFYKSTGLGDAKRARADLEEFASADANPFDRDLKPAPPIPPAAATAAR